MRRKDRAVPETEALALLGRAEYGVLSTASKSGQPYGVPLNFCIIGRCLFFHCAVEGRKIDYLEQTNSVSFCVVGNTEILPEKFSTKYESAIVAGKVSEVFGTEKLDALKGLLKKYSQQYIEEGIKYAQSSMEKTRVFKIEIHEVTGKAHK